MDDAALESRIRAFLRDELHLEEAADAAPEEPLVSAGLLDSTDLVRVVAFLERETAVSIPDEDVSVDHFDSLGDFVRYVGSRR